MIPTLNRAPLKAATEILESLGAAASYRQVYGEAHPRFREALARSQSLIGAFFRGFSEMPSLLYQVRSDRVEFQRIPLVGVSPQGERLASAFRDASCGLLEIDREISSDDVPRLVDALASLFRGGPETPGPDGSSGEPGKFRLVPAEEARELVTVKDLPEDSPERQQEEKDAGLPELLVSRDTLAAVIGTYTAFLQNAERGSRLDYDGLRQAAAQAVDLFSRDRNAPGPSLYRGYFDNFTFHHSVNVSLIATRLVTLVVPEPELQARVATAALLHDVGKMKVPTEVLMKPGKLTPAEIDLMKQHPVAGAEILLSTKDVDPLAVGAAFGHHCHGARGSYPRTRTPYPCDWVTRLISVVDIYEALTAVRPYKKALPPDGAIEAMITMPGLRDRLPLIKLLYDIFGPYPVGATVELDSGERAVVTEQNADEPYRPKIRIVTDRNRIPYPIPREVDLSAPPADNAAPLSIRQTVVVQEPGDDPLVSRSTTDSSQILRETLNDEEGFYIREG